MKKFYYKKESENNDSKKQTSQLSMSDFEKKRAELLKSLNLKTPIILQLDRRHTLNVNRNGDVSRFRATSISSLDQFKDIPKIPRVRPREVTKSLSEDYLANSIYAPSPSTVIITESELSSSWLYNSMKDNANFRDCNKNQTPLKSKYRSEPSLSPVMLQDPKMKPVPVKKKPRSEGSSSRYCYLTIMVIICLCALGFMSTIGGIIYLEVSSKNDSNIEDSSAQILLDVSDEVDETKPKISDERAEVNINQRIFDTEENSKDHADEDVPKKMVRILDFERKPDTDLTQFIDNTKTEIRMHDDSLIVYEENKSPEVKFEDISVRDSRLNEKDNNLRSQNDFSEPSEESKSSLDKLGTVSTTYLDVSKHLNSKNGKITMIGPIRYQKDSRKVLGEAKIVADLKTQKESHGNTEVSNQNTEQTKDNQAENINIVKTSGKDQDNLVSSETTDVVDAIGILPMVSNVFQEVDFPPPKSKDDENKASGQSISFKSDIKTPQENTEETLHQNDQVGKFLRETRPEEKNLSKNEPQEILPKNQPEEMLPENEHEGEILPENDLEGEISPENESEGEILSENEHEGEISPENERTSRENEPKKGMLQENEPDESDLNFESMVTAINEHIKSIEIQDNVFNGLQGGKVNTKVLENPRRDKLVTSSDEMKLPISNLPSQKFSNDVGTKAPQTDIRVSLAEAMKHLQVLDTQNKILSSRIKSHKPKIKITRPRLQTIVKQPDDKLKAKEQMNYLNNIRFILMDRLRNEM